MGIVVSTTKSKDDFYLIDKYIKLQDPRQVPIVCKSRECLWSGTDMFKLKMPPWCRGGTIGTESLMAIRSMDKFYFMLFGLTDEDRTNFYVPRFFDSKFESEPRLKGLIFPVKKGTYEIDINRLYYALWRLENFSGIEQVCREWSMKGGNISCKSIITKKNQSVENAVADKIRKTLFYKIINGDVDVPDSFCDSVAKGISPCVPSSDCSCSDRNQMIDTAGFGWQTEYAELKPDEFSRVKKKNIQEDAGGDDVEEEEYPEPEDDVLDIMTFGKKFSDSNTIDNILKCRKSRKCSRICKSRKCKVSGKFLIVMYLLVILTLCSVSFLVWGSKRFE